jgi:hypothetical protein
VLQPSLKLFFLAYDLGQFAFELNQHRQTTETVKGLLAFHQKQARFVLVHGFQVSAQDGDYPRYFHFRRVAQDWQRGRETGSAESACDAVTNEKVSH